MSNVVRLAAMRRLDRMRARRAVRDAARHTIEAFGEGWAGIHARAWARDPDHDDKQRRFWADVEAEIARQVGFVWFCGDEVAAGA